jgi:diacylglycerol kinase family enzyme
MRPAVLIYNPRAGHGRAAGRLGRLSDILRSCGWAAEPRATIGPGHATALARQAAAGGAAAVFVYGGDGTLREAAAGVLGREVPLGFLPGGTANVMRRELGLPRRPEAAARALADARPRMWDVGLCGGEPFLMMASAGLDAAVLTATSTAAKGLLGSTAVIASALSQWWSYGYPTIELRADGEPLAGSLIVVGNISRYGGPWRILPAARSDDRQLDLLVLAGAGRLASLGFARDLFLLRGRHPRRRDVSLARVQRVELLGPPGLPIQLDGDPRPLAPPLEITLATERVRLLSPLTAAP